MLVDSALSLTVLIPSYTIPNYSIHSHVLDVSISMVRLKNRENAQGCTAAAVQLEFCVLFLAARFLQLTYRAPLSLHRLCALHTTVVRS